MTDVPRGTSVTCARPHSNLHDNDSTTIIDKKTLFGVHAQVSYMYICKNIDTNTYIYFLPHARLGESLFAQAKSALYSQLLVTPAKPYIHLVT